MSGVNLGFLEAFLGLNTAGFTAGLAKAQKSMAVAGKSMQRAGKTMTTSLSLPLALVGGASIKMAVDFEKSFSKIEGLVGIAADKVQAFRKDVLSLAGRTAQAPNKLAEAMFFVTSAGLRGADALDVLTMSARAAAANVGDVVTIADLVTSATNAYGIEMLSAASATDTLVAAVREGKRPPEEIAGSIGRVLPVASELGVTFQEVGASIAAMSRTGTDAAEAVTGLRQILFSILKPSEGAKAAFKEMGTSAFDLKKMLGSEGGLIKLLSFLRDQTTESSNAFSKAFPNVRALAGALDIMGKNAEANKKIFADMVDNTGDLDKAFAVAAKTTDFKLKQAFADLKVALISVGEVLMPLFTNIVDWISKGVKAFNNLSVGSKQLIIAFGLVVIAAGPLIAALGTIAVLIGAITWPIIAVIAGVAALVAAIVVLEANWQAIKERISDWGWWKNMLLSMVQFFDRFLSGIVKDLNFLLSFLTDWQIPNIFEDWVNELEASKAPIDRFEHDFVSAGDAITAAFNKAKKAVSGAVSGLFGSGGGGGESPATSTSKLAVPGEVSRAGNLGLPLPPPETLEKVSAGFKTMTRDVTELGTAIQTSLNTAFVEFGETLGSLFSGDAGASTFFEGILGIVAGFMKTFGQALIAAGVASEAFKNLLSIGGGFGAIAAGVALIAASSVVKNLMKKGPSPQGLRSGGFVNQGGMFQLHKDELVNLPNGSAVTPAGMSKGKQDIVIHGEISGRVIKWVLDEENRITGNSN